MSDRQIGSKRTAQGNADRPSALPSSESKLRAKIQQLEAKIVGLEAEVDAASVAVAKMATIDEYLSRFPTGHLIVLDGRSQTVIRFDS